MKATAPATTPSVRIGKSSVRALNRTDLRLLQSYPGCCTSFVRESLPPDLKSYFHSFGDNAEVGAGLKVSRIEVVFAAVVGTNESILPISEFGLDRANKSWRRGLTRCRLLLISNGGFGRRFNARIIVDRERIRPFVVRRRVQRLWSFTSCTLSRLSLLSSELATTLFAVEPLTSSNVERRPNSAIAPVLRRLALYLPSFIFQREPIE
jgi:hypothetical protein